jgi:hypothetical protein
MDTPCIPEDHELRAEAIANINDVFANSKITLVRDRDLMEVDISEILEPGLLRKEPEHYPTIESFKTNVQVSESLLVLLLVCDWNVRAWTLLEAMKGRENIYLLCKNNATISLREALQTVLHQEAIDISILYLTAQHLLPRRVTHKPIEQRYLRQIELISLEEAGSLLSHRHASRDGDDTIIWSLLFNEHPVHTPEAMWKTDDWPHSWFINSSFLISSAPGIRGVKGLSWAPLSPTIRLGPEQELIGQQSYVATATSETSQCSVTPDGLEGAWFTYRFACNESARNVGYLAEIVALYLQGYQLGILLQPMSLNFEQKFVLRTLRHLDGPVLAVCGSMGDTLAWEWKGVYEWKGGEPLPEFHRDYLIIS